MRDPKDTALILDLSFSDVRDLERLSREFHQKKLTREQFISGVEEITAKLRQQLIALMDLPNEADIPF